MRIITAALLSLLAWQTHAYVGAVSSATAETGRASVEPTDSPFLNPASLPFMKGYFFTSGFSSTQNSDNARAQDFALSITDNMPETVVPTSVAFTQSKVDFASEEIVSRDFRLSFGNYIIPKWAMGFGLRYKDDQLPQERFTQGNMNLGLLYAPNADLGLAVVAENLIGSDTKIPADRRLSPTTALGATYIYRRFVRTRLDVISASNNSWDRPIVAAGLESYMNRWLILRLGFQRRNEEKANVYSGGMGFAGPRFGIHYAYLSSPDQESLSRHSVDLAIPIW
jgi:hypothetical protein